jgi:hypothetical protein
MTWILSALLSVFANPVRIAEKEPVRVADDSIETREFLIAESEVQRNERLRQKFDAAAIRKRERSGYVAPSRRKLRDFLTSAPGFSIETTTDAYITESLPDCRCTLSEIFTNRMVKIKINSGSYKGRVGWVCDDEVRRLNVWP